MEVLKKVLNIIIDIFIVLVVIVSAAIAVISITARDSGVANVFGYVPFSVQSNSMSPVFEAGDLIVGKMVPKEQRVMETFHKGDIVTFWTQILDEENLLVDVLNTHRIVDFRTDAGGNQIIVTKGDNNKEEDGSIVIPENIVAVWSTESKDDGIMVKKVGAALDFLRKPSGFFIAVVIPMIIFFIYELVRFITNFLNYNKEKQKEAALQAAKELMGNDSSDSSGLSEDQKAQAILEYLEKQKAEGGGEPPAAEAPPESEEAPAPVAEETAAEAPAEAAPAAEQTAGEAEQPAEKSDEAEETEQPAAEVSTEAVTEPEQEEAVSESSED